MRTVPDGSLHTTPPLLKLAVLLGAVTSDTWIRSVAKTGSLRGGMPSSPVWPGVWAYVGKPARSFAQYPRLVAFVAPREGSDSSRKASLQTAEISKVSSARRGRLGVAFLMLVLLGTGHLRAQVADNPVFISTDHPSIANSSVVVRKGDIQGENGMLTSNAQGDYTLDFPETALRFGLLNKTELRLSAPKLPPCPVGEFWLWRHYGRS